MIEVNLNPALADKSASNLGGMNFSQLNLKFVILGFIAIYATEPIVGSIYEDRIQKEEQRVLALRKEIRELKAEISSKSEVKNAVQRLKEQEVQLKNKISVVKDIVEKRQNPYLVLKYVAENTPKDVWVKQLEINDKALKIVGYSKTYQGAKNFLKNLESSIFFDGNVSSSKGEGLMEEYKGHRLETFVYKVNIVSFK